MSCELKLYINGEIKKAFLLAPLMNESNITRIVHSHKYAEIHIISGGNATLLVENERHALSSGDVCLVPAESYHCYLETDPDVRLVAFQTDVDVKEFKICRISEAMLAETVSVIKYGGFYSDCSGLSALLSYAVSPFFPPISVSKTEDIGVVIYEFISRNYNRSITLGDLAKALYLSERQTERLVKKYTGHTFKEAVTNYRLTVAEFLEKSTDMNKADVASYVGYLNYSGYYKAERKQTKREERMNNNENVINSFKKQAEKFSTYHMSKTEYTDYLIDKINASGNERLLDVAAGTCICGRVLAPHVLLSPKATEGECVTSNLSKNIKFRRLLPPQAVPNLLANFPSSDGG